MVLNLFFEVFSLFSMLCCGYITITKIEISLCPKLVIIFIYILLSFVSRLLYGMDRLFLDAHRLKYYSGTLLAIGVCPLTFVHQFDLDQIFPQLYFSNSKIA